MIKNGPELHSPKDNTLPPEAQRALIEAAERRKNAAQLALPKELGGRQGPELSLKAQDIYHIILPGLLALPPKGCAQGTARKYGAVGCQMSQHDALAISGKNYVVFTNNIATTNSVKANITPFAHTRNAVTP
jgi:hypothetical protein